MVEGWVDALYANESQHLFAAEKQEECPVNREQTGEGTVDLAAAVAGTDRQADLWPSRKLLPSRKMPTDQRLR